MSGNAKRGAYKSLDVVKKYEILQRLRKGESAANLSRELGIPRTSINGIKKNGDKMEDLMSKMEATDGDVTKRKRFKTCVNNELDEAMFIWFIQQRSQDMPISGPIITEMALRLNNKLNGDPDFKASQGWLEKFKARHGIRQLSIQGEQMSADRDVLPLYREKLKSEITRRGLTRAQVFNCDETGLNWKSLPKRTLVSASEKYAPGYKIKKDRVTVLVCSNASGCLKLPLLVIGKSKKPRAFKNLDLNSLPVNYFSQRSAWMTQEIFSKWFFNSFVPQVQKHLVTLNLPKKALLVMDNAPCHPINDLQTEDGNIKTIFLPANTTSLCQPMDQGVIESLKRQYRKMFLQNLIFCETEIQLEGFWKTFTIKDAIFSVADAWKNIKHTTLQASWNKLWPISTIPVANFEQTQEEKENLELRELCTCIPGLKDVTEKEIIDWSGIDKADAGYQILTEDEIVAEVLSKNNPNDETELEECDDTAVCSVTNQEAREMLTKCIEWYEDQKEVDISKVIVLRQVRLLALNKERQSKTQKKITDFFKK